MRQTVKASECSLNEALLRLAIMHERRVSFEYAKDDNRSDLRWCLPQALKDGSAGPLVVAWDEDRDDVRTFRLDRIEGDVTFA